MHVLLWREIGTGKMFRFPSVLFGNEWIISFSRVSQRREFIRSMSIVHNPKGCYKKLTKHLFFKHLYLICTLFITLCLSVMLYIPLTFHTSGPAKLLIITWSVRKRSVLEQDIGK